MNLKESQDGYGEGLEGGNDVNYNLKTEKVKKKRN